MPEEDLQHVKITLALLKAKAESADSLTFHSKQDSIYRMFHTSFAAYKSHADSLVSDSKRTTDIYNAIRDSLKIKQN